MKRHHIFLLLMLLTTATAWAKTIQSMHADATYESISRRVYNPSASLPETIQYGGVTYQYHREDVQWSGTNGDISFSNDFEVSAMYYSDEDFASDRVITLTLEVKGTLFVDGREIAISPSYYGTDGDATEFSFGSFVDNTDKHFETLGVSANAYYRDWLLDDPTRKYWLLYAIAMQYTENHPGEYVIARGAEIPPSVTRDGAGFNMSHVPYQNELFYLYEVETGKFYPVWSCHIIPPKQQDPTSTNSVGTFSLVYTNPKTTYLITEVPENAFSGNDHVIDVTLDENINAIHASLSSTKIKSFNVDANNHKYTTLFDNDILCEKDADGNPTRIVGVTIDAAGEKTLPASINTIAEHSLHPSATGIKLSTTNANLVCYDDAFQTWTPGEAADANSIKMYRYITLGNGVTVSGDGVTTEGNTITSVTEQTVTVTGTIPAGYEINFLVKDANDNTIPVNNDNGVFSFTMPSSDVTVSAVYTPEDWATKTTGDSEATAYIIYNNEQLDLLATRVNNGDTYAGKYFMLGADICYDNSSANNFTPIGTASNPFMGVFMGDGYIIQGIRVNDELIDAGLFGAVKAATLDGLSITDARIKTTWSQDEHTELNCGILIGKVQRGATIRNCTITDSYCTCEGNSNRKSTGGLAGYVEYQSKFIGCKLNNIIVIGGHDTGGFIGRSYANNYYERCDVFAEVTGDIDSQQTNIGLGGFVGRINASVNIIRQCSFDGSVSTSTMTNIGGFIGFCEDNSGHVEECFAISSVTNESKKQNTGGFIGYAKSDDNHPFTLSDCYCVGTVNANGEMSGGFAGSLTSNVTVTRCFCSNEIEGNSSLFRGAFIGKAASGASFTDCAYDAMPNPSGFKAMGTSKNSSEALDNVNPFVRSTDIETRFASYLTTGKWLLTDNDTPPFLKWTFPSYVDQSGTRQLCPDNNHSLDGTEISLDAGWYLVDGTIRFDHQITLLGDVNIILANGAKMTVSTDSGYAIDATTDGTTLSIYSQSIFPANAGTLCITGSIHPYVNVNIVSSQVTINGNSQTPAPVTGDWDMANGANGSETKPYVIRTPADLDMLAQRVNSGTGDADAANGYEGKFFILDNDIAYDYAGLTDTESNYTSIGYIDNKETSLETDDVYYAFKGTFDGKGHTISGIRIHEITKFGQGLFGCLKDGTVKNVTIDDTHITGCEKCGGIVGHNIGGTVINCHATNDVTIMVPWSTIYYIASIVGYNAGGTVSHCTSAASISGYRLVGGIVGYNKGTVKNCLAVDNVISCMTPNHGAGAIASYNEGTLSHNYYNNCTLYAGTKAPATTDIGTQNGDVNENDGAVKATWASNALALADNASNATALALAVASNESYFVTLTDRTLLKNGDWNTLCLPFSLTADQIAASDLSGATIKELDNSISGTSLNDEGLLTLKFTDATTIEAGKPYLVKWETTDADITSPMFFGVTISSATPTPIISNDQKVVFVGQYSPFEIVESGATGDNQGNKNEIILMSSGNKLGYSKNPRTIANGKALKCFRCHFYIPMNNGQQANSFVLDFGEGETTTGIISMSDGRSQMSDSWYTLDGRKLDKQPTAKGIYMNKGHKVVIK